ncbi:insulinase family protein [candidate division WOR-3 bacterium]|nr:insulinase family protein [candidate division WOR-3 bacterium]
MKPAAPRPFRASALRLLTSAFCLLCTAHALPLFRDSLPNGLVVLTYEDHRLPMTDVALVCRSGASFDPEGLAGAAALCAHLLARGTPGVSGDSISSLVEFLGAQFEGSADHDHAVLRLRVLSKDLDQGLDLLAAGARTPDFSEKELKLARDQFLSGARRRYDHPQHVVTSELVRLLFPGHPYAWPAAGDTGTLPAVTRDDVVSFHRRHLVPNNCYLVAVGDVDRQTVIDKVRTRFGDWQPAPVPALSAATPAWPEGIRVKVITRPDLNQSYVHLGHPGLSVHAPDMLAARLMSYVLGGAPLSSRLGLTVREEGGLAYDVRCWFARDELDGGFHATVQTRDPRPAIEMMLAEIRKMRGSGATRAELLKAHNFFTGSFPLTYSSNRGKLDMVITQELRRFGDDWLTRFPDDVRAVTIDQVNQAARDRLRPESLFLVVMGPLTREELGLTGVEYID